MPWQTGGPHDYVPRDRRFEPCWRHIISLTPVSSLSPGGNLYSFGWERSILQKTGALIRLLCIESVTRHFMHRNQDELWPYEPVLLTFMCSSPVSRAPLSPCISSIWMNQLVQKDSFFLSGVMFAADWLRLSTAKGEVWSLNYDITRSDFESFGKTLYMIFITPLSVKGVPALMGSKPG